uniref:BRCT domain-containing protein n=1 Tax=Heterorhabditis bacteriophora TaxID=37862 RepID=A0A1I7XQR8_HETBA
MTTAHNFPDLSLSPIYPDDGCQKFPHRLLSADKPISITSKQGNEKNVKKRILRDNKMWMRELVSDLNISPTSMRIIMKHNMGFCPYVDGENEDKNTLCVVSGSGLRTLSTLRAVISGVPVVNKEWIKSCMNENRLVSSKIFEFDQWRWIIEKRRTECRIFSRLGIIMVLRGVTPSSHDIRWMIRKSGGKVKMYNKTIFFVMIIYSSILVVNEMYILGCNNEHSHSCSAEVLIRERGEWTVSTLIRHFCAEKSCSAYCEIASNLGVVVGGWNGVECLRNVQLVYMNSEIKVIVFVLNHQFKNWSHTCLSILNLIISPILL